MWSRRGTTVTWTCSYMDMDMDRSQFSELFANKTIKHLTSQPSVAQHGLVSPHNTSRSHTGASSQHHCDGSGDVLLQHITSTPARYIYRHQVRRSGSRRTFLSQVPLHACAQRTACLRRADTITRAQQATQIRGSRHRHARGLSLSSLPAQHLHLTCSPRDKRRAHAWHTYTHTQTTDMFTAWTCMPLASHAPPHL